MSLSEQLQQIVEASQQRIPAEVRKLMKQATEELRNSGIENKVLKEGGTLPPFDLPNMEGDLVSSAKLLEKGKLVLTFYRGVW